MVLKALFEDIGRSEQERIITLKGLYTKKRYEERRQNDIVSLLLYVNQI